MSELNRVREAEVGLAILRILARQPSGEARLDLLKRELSSLAQRWMELESDPAEYRMVIEAHVKTIRTRKDATGNIFSDGLVVNVCRGKWRITKAGRLHLGRIDRGRVKRSS